MKFRDRVARFFQGRNGVDHLSRIFIWICFGLLILSFLFSRIWGGIASTIIWGIGLVCLIYSYWRVLSKNISKRREENAKFLYWRDRMKGRLRKKKLQFQQRKEFKFFSCPNCKTTLRVPKGKGTLQISCRQCGTKFKGKS